MSVSSTAPWTSSRAAFRIRSDRGEAGEFSLGEPLKVAALMNRFFSHDESDEREFHRAMDEFKSRIPDQIGPRRSRRILPRRTPEGSGSDEPLLLPRRER